MSTKPVPAQCGQEPDPRQTGQRVGGEDKTIPLQELAGRAEPLGVYAWEEGDSGLAFPGSLYENATPPSLNLLALALRALDRLLLFLSDQPDNLKGLLAFDTPVLVDGHGGLLAIFGLGSVELF